MAGNRYQIGTHIFYNEKDYRNACRDEQLIKELRKKTNFQDRKQVAELYGAIQSGGIRFSSVLGTEFDDEVYEIYQQLKAKASQSGTAGKERPHRTGNSKKRAAGGPAGASPERAEAKRGQGASQRHTEAKRGQGASQRHTEARRGQGASQRHTEARRGQGASEQVEKEAKRILAGRDRRRRLLIAACGIVAIACIGYYACYYLMTGQAQSSYDRLSELKEQDGSALPDMTVTFTDDSTQQEIVLTVLDEYKTLYNKNKSLIGWIKIDDTNIDYPVMQSPDPDYYLTHDFYQEYDKNGSIFLDPACDIVDRSTNLIIYGHHMKSGKMFGSLENYSRESFYQEHRYITFDTIYEKGTYEIMYVFRSRIYHEDEIVFKYYQFIDVDSEAEFYSNMNEMAALSLYDTGVTAEYGDELLTLSTCDYQEANGRFVVVAKRIE